jgi:hypothetical protein
MYYHVYMYSPSPKAQEAYWIRPPRPPSLPPPSLLHLKLPRTRGWEWWTWKKPRSWASFALTVFWHEVWLLRYIDHQRSVIWPVQPNQVETVGSVSPYKLTQALLYTVVTQQQNEERETPLEKQNYQQEQRKIQPLLDFARPNTIYSKKRWTFIKVLNFSWRA